ncbi:MAG: phosphatidylglycerophosphatase A [Planctomycetes bacterium]|nr:phosphatidylglycerophosphatase A [Planctomycetota bacterium]
MTDAAPPAPAASPGDRAALWVLSVGGLGFLPLVPGTFGTVAGVLVALVTFGQGPLHALLGACVLTVLLGPAACRAAGRKDPSSVVMDEVAGVLLALAFTPDPTPLQAAWGFLFFRAFDILKPFPGRRLERLPGGWGILLDDLAAGFYAAAALWGLGRIVPLA